MTAPTPGRIVLYTLTEDDATAVNRRRKDFQAFCGSHEHPHEPGQPGATGHVGHVGNTTRAGDVYPAMIVRIWTPGNPDGTVNLQVHLDGNDTYWAPSRIEGTGPGSWAWPARAGM